MDFIYRSILFVDEGNHPSWSVLKTSLMPRQWYHTSGPSCVLELDVACVSTFGFVSGKVPISKPKPCIDHLQIFMALGPSANVFLCTKGWFPIWLAFDVLSLIDLDELKLLFIRTCPLFKIEKVLKCSNNVNSSACLSNIFCWWNQGGMNYSPFVTSSATAFLCLSCWHLIAAWNSAKIRWRSDVWFEMGWFPLGSCLLAI